MNVIAGLGRADPFADLGRLEAVKWLAFVAMVCDHVDLALFGRGVPWLHALGTFAFPAFCLTFGLGVATSSNPLAVAKRLVLPAIIAQAAWLVIRPEHPLNVLAVFAACAALEGTAGRWLGTKGAGYLALAGVAGYVGEGGPWGVMLVAGASAARDLRRWWPLATVGALWAVLVPTPGTLAALAAVAWWPASWPRIPRTRGLFAWAYAGHLAVLAALTLATLFAG